MTRSIRKWSDVADGKVQDCFASIDWNMCWDSSNGIDDVVHTMIVHTYPNQKPWITGNIDSELNARAAAFMEQDSNQDVY